MTDKHQEVDTSSTNDSKKTLTLKFEHHGQQFELASLTTGDTVGDLRAVICSMLNIDDFKRINLKTLQPTKIIDTTDDTRALSNIFRQTRERIVVEEVYSSASASASSAGTNLQAGSSSRIPTHKSLSGIKHRKSDSEQPIPLDQSGQSSLFIPESLSPDRYQDQLVDSGADDSPTRQRKTPRQPRNDSVSDYPVCSSTGYLLRHPVPSNNSCLFISVHFCLTNGVVDDQIGKSMRKIIADTVASDTERFDEAFLGKPNSDYCKWILDDNNWGGGIELSILCKYYKTEIVAIDVKNTILNRFGEDSLYPQRMLLLYDGLHYDPLKFQPLDDSHPTQTLFSTENLEVLTLAEELAKEAKQSHQFTDVNSISLKCNTCNASLDAKTAPEHAAKTGHIDFVEKND